MIDVKDKREQILEQAVTIFGEKGYYKTTTAQVAHAVGVTQPYIFHFFKTKEALFQAVLDKASAVIIDAFAEAEKSPGAIAKNMGDAFNAIMASHPNEVRMVMQAHAIAEPAIREHVAAIYSRIHEWIADKFRKTGLPNPEAEAAKFISIGQFMVVIDVLELPGFNSFKNGHME